MKTVTVDEFINENYKKHFNMHIYLFIIQKYFRAKFIS